VKRMSTSVFIIFLVIFVKRMLRSISLNCETDVNVQHHDLSLVLDDPARHNPVVYNPLDPQKPKWIWTSAIKICEADVDIHKGNFWGCSIAGVGGT